MKAWKRMMAAALGSVLVLSQGIAAFAQEDLNAAAGSDTIVEESAVPQQGAGIGTNIQAGGGTQEGLVGTIGLGAGADLGSFDTESYMPDTSGDTDTCVLDDIGLALRIQGSYMLTDAEDDKFYYIYTWGEQGIPDMMVGQFDVSTTDGFFDEYVEYMKQVRTDLTVTEGPSAVTIGDKSLEKVVFNYTIQGYNISDTRYIWLAPNNSVYMFTKREIPDLSYMLGNSLEDIITGASLTGMETPQPAPAPEPETTAPQPETTAPQPETTAPEPETTAPTTGGDRLYMQNDDSSWAVTTKYFTMTIPPAWTGHFDAAVLEQDNGGYNLQVVNKESKDAGFGGHLFTIMLMPESEDYTVLPSYDYLGTMLTPEGTFSVVVLYPTDAQTGDIWQEFYKILNGDKNSAITTVRPVAGVTWTLPDGKVISSDASAPAPQPETTAPAGSTDVLGTTSGTAYSNGLFGLNFSAPAGWILANQDQLVTLNQNLAADQFLPSIEAGVPVCIAYAQSADGMEIMNVVAENGKSFLDPSIQALTQEDIKAILNEAVSVSTSSLESLGATVTGATINTVSCMGQTCYSLDITFNYGGFSGTQRQIGIPAGTYIAMITVRSVNGDNTQATLDMFSAV